MKNLSNKIFFSILIIVIFISYLISYSFGIEDKIKLFYEIYYGPFKVGESEIYITPGKYTAIVYSVGLANVLFPYYAKWETWVDKKGFPEKSVIYSKEKGKERKRIIYFKKEEEKIVYQKLLPECKKPEDILLKFPIHDELSSFIASFYIDYTKQSQVQLPLFIKKSREYIKIEFKEKQNCNFEDKKSECFHIKIFLPKKSELLERASEAEMLLWEERRVPLELRGKLPIFGSLVGKLKKIEEL